MSMNVTLFRLPAKTLARVKKDADFLEELSSGEHEYESVPDAEARYPADAGELHDEDGELVCGFLELATGWRELEAHFAKEPLLVKAIHGDRVVHDDVDLGYGPGMLMSAANVAKVAKILEKPAKGVLSARLAAALGAPPVDPRKKSYKNDAEAETDRLQRAYADLRLFYGRAAAAKQAVLWTGA